MGTPEGDLLDVLETLIETYESEHHPHRVAPCGSPSIGKCGDFGDLGDRNRPMRPRRRTVGAAHLGDIACRRWAPTRQSLSRKVRVARRTEMTSDNRLALSAKSLVSISPASVEGSDRLTCS